MRELCVLHWVRGMSLATIAQPSASCTCSSASAFASITRRRRSPCTSWRRTLRVVVLDTREGVGSQVLQLCVVHWVLGLQHHRPVPVPPVGPSTGSTGTTITTLHAAASVADAVDASAVGSASAFHAATSDARIDVAVATAAAAIRAVPTTCTAGHLGAWQALCTAVDANA